MGAASKQLHSFSGSAMALGASMTRRVSVPILATGAAATGMAMSFNHSMSLIGSLVGASGQQMDQYRKGVLQLARDGPIGPKALADALYFVTSSGFKGAAALDVLKASSRAAAAGLGSTSDVADAVTSAVNAYGAANLTASQATDVLLATVREGKAEPTELAQSIGRVIAPAQNMGITFGEVGGALAGLSLTGLDAAEAVTGLRGIIGSFLGPGKQAKEVMTDFGLSAAGIRKSIDDDGLLTTLQHLRDQFRGHDDELKKLFPNIRAYNAFLALTGSNAEKNAAVMQKVVTATGDTNRAFAIASQDGLNKMKTAWSQIQVAAIQVGSAIAPTVTTVAGKIGELATAFTQLSPSTQRFIGIGVAFAAALGPIVGIVGSVVRVMQGLRVAMLSVATTPMGAGLAALGILLGGLAAHFISAQIEAAHLAQAMRDSANAAYMQKGALDTLQGANLNLETAQHNVTASLHDAQAAQATYNGFVNQGTQETLAGKQAHDQAISSWDRHKQAVQQLNAATDAHTKAQTTATATTRNALQPLLAFDASVTQNIRSHQAAIPVLSTFSRGLNILSAGFLGSSQANTADEASVRKWGTAMVTAGTTAVRTAQSTEKMSPAARAAQQAVGLMTEAAGRFAQRSGEVPRKISDITREAARLHPQQFQATMQAWISAAQKAGVGIPRWVRTGLNQAKQESATASGLMKASMTSVPAVWSAAGSAAGAGLADAIRGQLANIGAAASAAAAAAKIPLSSDFGSTPDEWARKNVGEPLMRGIVQGILAGKTWPEKAAAQAKMGLRAQLQAQDLVALATSWGDKIGRANAMGIIRGLVGMTPSLKAQAAQQMRDMFAEQQKAIAEGRTAFISSFNSVAQGAVDALYNKLAAGTTAAGRRLKTQLDSMKLVDSVNQITQGLGSAVTSAELALMRAYQTGTDAAVRSATNALTSALIQSQRDVEATTQANVDAAKAALTAAEATGDPEKVAEAQRNLDTALADQKTALDTHYNEVRTLAETNLEEGIAREQRKQEGIARNQATGLATQLADLRKYLLEHPKEWDKTSAEIIRVLNKWHVPMHDGGLAFANQFAQGIRDGIPDVQDAAREMAGAAAGTVPHSPAKEGPLAFDIRQTMRAWAREGAAGVKEGAMTVSPVDWLPGRQNAPQRGRGAASGGPVVQVHVNNPTFLTGDRRAVQDLARVLKPEIERVVRLAG